MFRLPVYALLVVACGMTSGGAQAQDVALKDAIQCKDFQA